MNRRFLRSLLLTLLAPPRSTAQIFGIKDFGVVADAKTLNTEAIQRAIDTCAAAGGGEVGVPAGIFGTGSLRFKSDMTLRFSPGAVLQTCYPI